MFSVKELAWNLSPSLVLLLSYYRVFSMGECTGWPVPCYRGKWPSFRLSQEQMLASPLNYRKSRALFALLLASFHETTPILFVLLTGALKNFYKLQVVPSTAISISGICFFKILLKLWILFQSSCQNHHSQKSFWQMSWQLLPLQKAENLKWSGSSQVRI